MTPTVSAVIPTVGRQSLICAVQSVLDPETEYNRIDALLTDLVVLDEWLAAYKRRIR